ncbi:hypothetical protein LP416_31080 [Polaromonas sp. P2-4]|nr:hypothetical protein LP416_31080 [Polaromonas sp. P2-4]
MMVTVVELIGVALSALVWSLPHLFYHAGSPPIAITWVALTVTAAGLAFLRPGARWLTGSGVGLGLLVVTAVQIIVDGIRDPTSHNLFPFEIVIALALGFPPAILGVLLGNLMRRKVPWPQLGGIVLVALAVGGAAVSAWVAASDIIRAEALALKKIAALIAAQHAFRAAHPLRGFTCDLGELGVPLSGPITSSHPSESYRLDGVVYRGGTAVIEDRYRYSLKCLDQSMSKSYLPEGKPDPQGLFILTARPAVEQLPIRRPPDIFCAGPDGAIRSVRIGKLYSCFAEGRIVQK